MGFEQLAKVESRIHKLKKYFYLLDKHYSGKTLEERTYIENDDFLSKCNGQVIRRVAGTQYCGGLTKEFDCRYQCNPTINGMRPCSRFYDKGIEFYDKIIAGVMNLDEDDICIAAKFADSGIEINEDYLGDLEERARRLNENTIFKQRVYCEKLRE